MLKNITIIACVSLIILLFFGWYRTYDDYKEIKDTLSYVLEDYVETGNKLNECMERGNKVFN